MRRREREDGRGCVVEQHDLEIGRRVRERCVGTQHLVQM